MASRPLLTAAALAAGIAGSAIARPALAQAADQTAAPAAVSSVTAASPGVDDPFESTNRKLYAFNTKVDRVLVRPGVAFYHHATPTPVRHGLHNVLVNMTHPVIIINDVLQLRPVRALTALGRFTINSTVGLGGVFDVAGSSFPYHNSDFGLTLARYGVRQGPYFFVPILGPTTLRDAVGRGADAVIDPFNSVNYVGRDILAPVRAITGGVDARDQIDPTLKALDHTATDPYATIRSAYLQNREAQVRGEADSAANVQALPDFGPASGGSTPPAPTAPAGSGTGPIAPGSAAPSPGPGPSAQAVDPVADILAAAPSAASDDAPVATGAAHDAAGV